jgi:hypothetical protein
VIAFFSFLPALVAKGFPLDLSRVVVIGHSAGGQLALRVCAASHDPGAGHDFPSSRLERFWLAQKQMNGFGANGLLENLPWFQLYLLA